MRALELAFESANAIQKELISVPTLNGASRNTISIYDFRAFLHEPVLLRSTSPVCLYPCKHSSLNLPEAVALVIIRDVE